MWSRMICQYGGGAVFWRNDWGKSGEIHEDARWDVDGEREVGGFEREDRDTVESEKKSKNYVLMIVTGKRW